MEHIRRRSPTGQRRREAVKCVANDAISMNLIVPLVLGDFESGMLGSNIRMARFEAELESYCCSIGSDRMGLTVAIFANSDHVNKKNLKLFT